MNRPRPTLKLLPTLLTMSRQRFNALTRTLRFKPDTQEGRDATIDEMLLLGLADWMASINVLPQDVQVSVLIDFEKSLDAFCRAYELHEGMSRTKRPAASFVVIDSRLVTMPAPFHGKGYYDTEDGTWLDTPPPLSLTYVSCDLSSLLLRILRRIEHVSSPTPEDPTNATATND